MFLSNSVLVFNKRHFIVVLNFFNTVYSFLLSIEFFIKLLLLWAFFETKIHYQTRPARVVNEQKSETNRVNPSRPRTTAKILLGIRLEFE